MKFENFPLRLPGLLQPAHGIDMTGLRGLENTVSTACSRLSSQRSVEIVTISFVFLCAEVMPSSAGLLFK
jgi:hypothetical protein